MSNEIDQLVQLLRQVLSPEEQKRDQAEETIKKIASDKPDEFVMGLLKVLEGNKKKSTFFKETTQLKINSLLVYGLRRPSAPFWLGFQNSTTRFRRILEIIGKNKYLSFYRRRKMKKQEIRSLIPLEKSVVVYSRIQLPQINLVMNQFGQNW